MAARRGVIDVLLRPMTSCSSAQKWADAGLLGRLRAANLGPKFCADSLGPLRPVGITSDVRLSPNVERQRELLGMLRTFTGRS
jgi:hypothetical protein